MQNLKLNPSLKISVLIVPNTDISVYVVDDFLLDTASVLNFAHKVAYYHPMFSDNSFYPGKRDHMPEPYMRLLASFFKDYMLPRISRTEYQSVTFHKCLLSLITCQPDALILDQKVPHIDSFDDRDFAFVHYLSTTNLGGTSIYRFIPENLVEFREKDKGVLSEMLIKAAESPHEHSGYLNETTSVFERVLKIEPKFNRLVIYQGNILHSANINCASGCNQDPKIGRLSISSFASVR
ncbi:DUF6445 family protein [Pseudoalteromonas sp. Of11M-6]|uniref:DUF6445 family protein n=1 Tax=Pseudoalteromonas sp. Of11M-6 TaxID=2917754 RepID=UPI001EF55598|nr:DUF6445 family protein [Pseudoalteromonas sp. Of11M-6]MCG7553343.1 DUF6445 family protein [Pseudoalteromonas sp. Of11M-6]